MYKKKEKGFIKLSLKIKEKGLKKKKICGPV